MSERKVDDAIIGNPVSHSDNVIDWNRDVAQKCKTLSDELRDLEATLLGRIKEILEVVGVGPIDKRDKIIKVEYNAENLIINYRRVFNEGTVLDLPESRYEIQVFTFPYHMLGVTKA